MQFITAVKKLSCHPQRTEHIFWAPEIMGCGARMTNRRRERERERETDREIETETETETETEPETETEIEKE